MQKVVRLSRKDSVDNRLRLQEQLRLGKDRVLGLWEELAYAKYQSCRPHTGFALKSVLPNVLNWILESLYSDSPLDLPWTEPRLSSVQSVEYERPEDYSLEEVLSEWCLFRQALGEVLAESHSSLQLILDRVMIASVSGFMRTRSSSVETEKLSLEILQSLAGEMLEIGDSAKTLQRLIETVVESMHARAGLILLYHPELRSLELKSSTGVSVDCFDFYKNLLETASYGVEFAAEEQSIRIIHASAFERLISQKLNAEGVETIVSIRLSSRGRLLGKICLGFSEPLGASASELRALELLGQRLATLFDNAGIYAQTQIERDEFKTVSQEAVTERNQSLKEVASLVTERSLREQFISTVTHDLRNPLAVARSCAELLVQTADRPEIVRKLGMKIVESVDRSDQMIRDLLDASQIRGGRRLPLEISECHLSEILKTTVDGLSLIHGDRFILSCDASIIGFWSSSGLRRVVENLAQNAVKYGSALNSITVSCRQNKQNVQLSVHNWGNPLSAEEQGKLFEPFERTRAAEATGKKGWGLGLSLVKGLVEAQGGEVQVTSSAREGTTFTVTLPWDCRSNTKGSAQL